MITRLVHRILNAITIISLLLFLGCKEKYNDKLLKNANSTVLKAIESIEFDNARLYESLVDSVYDFRHRDRALKYQPIASEVRENTKVMIEFCKTLKEISALAPKYVKETGTINLIHTQFKFYNKIIVEAFKKVNFKIDKNNLISKFSFDLEKYSPDNFRDDYFQSSSISEIELSISTLELYIKLSENELLKHCFYSTLNYGDSWGNYSPIIFQNSSILKPGEILEINAGIGEFSKAAQPKLTFNGRKSEPNESGVFLYRQRIGKDTGFFSIPVRIEYSAPDGTMMSYNGTVKYQVKE